VGFINLVIISSSSINKALKIFFYIIPINYAILLRSGSIMTSSYLKGFHNTFNVVLKTLWYLLNACTFLCVGVILVLSLSLSLSLSLYIYIYIYDKEVNADFKSLIMNLSGSYAVFLV
jgi:hypothetical protein